MDAEISPWKKGMIIIWYGSEATIPKGWAVCKGTNGTPNLQGKFVIGAGADPPQGASGGSTTHSHSGSPADHGHGLGGGTDIAAGGDFSADTGGSMGSGTVDVTDQLQPFFALVYIMKL